MFVTCSCTPSLPNAETCVGGIAAVSGIRGSAVVSVMGGTGTVAGVPRTCVRGSSTAAGKTGGSAVDLAGVRRRSVTDDGAKSRSVKRSRMNGNTPALTNPASTFRGVTESVHAYPTMSGMSYMVMPTPGWFRIQFCCAREVLFFKGPNTDISKGCNLCEQ